MTPHSDQVEHLMRITDSTTAILAAADADTTGWAPALGARLQDLTPVFTSGTPLCGAVTGQPVDPAWRDRVPTQPGSAWEERLFLLQIHGRSGSADLLEDLHLLRTVPDGTAEQRLFRN